MVHRLTEWSEEDRTSVEQRLLTDPERDIIDDPLAGATKRRRLFEARQHRDRRSNNIVDFIHADINPAHDPGQTDQFETRRSDPNEVLAFCGYQIVEDGKLRECVAAKTLTEGGERAGRLRAELRRRGVHPDVLGIFHAELAQKTTFHAVFEATKGVADKVRSRISLAGDGAGLVD